MSGIKKKFGPRAYALIAVVICLTGLPCILGFGHAAKQKAFFVFADDSELAVIRLYSDRILAIPVDRKQKTARPQLHRKD
jgi:hypothetical protein